MSASHSPDHRPLVARALRTARPTSVRRIHRWGLYHDSRLAAHVLAHLAHPQDPDALVDPGGDRSGLAAVALDLDALSALGAALASRARTDAERAHALELLDLAFERTGGNLPSDYRELHVITAYLVAGRHRAEALMRAYGDVSEVIGNALACQDSHPRQGGSAAEFTRNLQRLTGWSELEAPGEGENLSIDTLRTRPVQAVAGGPLISILMTCFKPGPALLTAVRSVIAQSWQHWELIVVDDGSGPEYHDILVEASSLDPRVKLLIQPENGGTYQARNRALAVAEGEFVTGLDSDDWAHPLRLEKQVAAFLDNPGLVMVESRSLAVRDDLSLMIDPEVAVMASRSTLIMVRAEPVMAEVGFYDEVRKTADSEYRSRVKERFGPKSWRRMKGGPLTLVRHADTTLSAGEVARYWMTTSRLAYHSGFTHWHREGREQEGGLYLSSYPRPRPFPITADISRTKGLNQAVVYERLYAADWRTLDAPRSAMLREAARAAAEGAAIGLVNCPEWVDVDGERPLIARPVLEAAATAGIDFLDLEPEQTAPVVVPSAAYAELLEFEHPGLQPDRVVVHAAATGAADADDAPAMAPRDGATTAPLRRGDAVLAGLGLLAVGTTTAVAFAIEPASLPAAATASLVVWAAGTVAVIGRRLAARPASL